jgi:hypothetical protein
MFYATKYNLSLNPTGAFLGISCTDWDVTRECELGTINTNIRKCHLDRSSTTHYGAVCVRASRPMPGFCLVRLLPRAKRLNTRGPNLVISRAHTAYTTRRPRTSGTRKFGPRNSSGRELGRRTLGRRTLDRRTLDRRTPLTSGS